MKTDFRSARRLPATDLTGNADFFPVAAIVGAWTFLPGLKHLAGSTPTRLVPIRVPRAWWSCCPLVSCGEPAPFDFPLKRVSSEAKQFVGKEKPERLVRENARRASRVACLGLGLKCGGVEAQIWENSKKTAVSCCKLGHCGDRR